MPKWQEARYPRECDFGLWLAQRFRSPVPLPGSADTGASARSCMSSRRTLGFVLVGIAGTALAAAAGVHVRSEQRLRDVPQLVRFEIPIPADSASLAWGEHLALMRGCVSCHGAQLEGRDFTEEWPESGVTVAPNLATLIGYRRAQPVVEAELPAPRGTARWARGAEVDVERGQKPFRPSARGRGRGAVHILALTSPASRAAGCVLARDALS